MLDARVWSIDLTKIFKQQALKHKEIKFSLCALTFLRLSLTNR